MSTDQDVSSQDHFQYNENCSDEEESMVTDNDEKRLSKQMEGMEVDPMHRLSNASNNNVPLQRLVNSVRRPRGPPSLKKDQEMTLLIQGWLVHYTNTNEMRMRHFWRLTSRAVILYRVFFFKFICAIFLSSLLITRTAIENATQYIYDIYVN